MGAEPMLTGSFTCRSVCLTCLGRSRTNACKRASPGPRHAIQANVRPA